MEILYKKENYILAKKVFIDPGHGGNDSGAVGINNLLEKDITLSVANLLQILGKLIVLYLYTVMLLMEMQVE